MSRLHLFDGPDRAALLPLTYTRPVAELRCGILTVREKYEHWFEGEVACLPVPYLRTLYPIQVGEDNLLVDGGILPDTDFRGALQSLEPGHALRLDGQVIAARLNQSATQHYADTGNWPATIVGHDYPATLLRLRRPADIFLLNEGAIAADYASLTAGRTSQPLSPTNTLIGPADQLFLEQGATVEAATLNVSQGPIYLARHATILEGSLLRGPIALGEYAVLKMGAKLYGATTLGPYCKVGGEVNNVVFQANSNKGHDGYLGNAIIGQWCNIGADTNASNLRNDYGEVRVWSYPAGRFAPTGLQFHGLVMADHAKAGINTMFNTGSVVGVAANVFGEGFPRTFIPSFSWGGASGLQTYRLDKALATAERVMARRGLELGAAEREMLTHVFAESKGWRRG